MSVASPARSMADLEASLRRLDDRVRRWSPTRWAASGARGRTRSAIAYELALALAELGRAAGNGVPQAVPPQLAPHGIADQLSVLGQELLNAPMAAAHAEAGLAAIARASAEL